MDEIEISINKWALKNAHDYGSANAGKIIGKVLSEHPQMKNQTKELMGKIAVEVQRINEMTKEQVEAELSKYSFEEKKKEEEKGISLPNAVQGKVITRFPPEPSGFLHIGHAKAAFLNFEGARAHGGKMRLRMDETNPLKSKQEFVDATIEYLRWLGIKWDFEITYSSDYMEKYYELADELMLKGMAYVCTCSQDEIKKGRESGKRCDCQCKMPEENVIDFRKMMNGKFTTGQAIVRYKGDMKSDNTVMRDPTLFRIIDAPHFRQKDKYKCWPSYDFAAPIIDSTEGVTHAMRSKEYELRDELYYAILDALEMRKPKLISFSRLAIKGAPISKRLITPLIEEGKVSGYDDIRLPTLAALKKRGITPEAIKKFVLSFGLTKVESEPGWDKLLSENRKIIDVNAQRRFFVHQPARVEISGLMQKNISVKNHPQNEGLGVREMLASSPAYICQADADAIAEGETFRLKDWCNVKLKAKRKISAHMPDGKEGQMDVLECEFVSDEGNVQKKMQWVADSAKAVACVLVPHDLYIDEKFNENSLEEVWGWTERTCLFDIERNAFQFERFGFVMLDKKGERLQYFFISQ
ncbi:MAG: glutamate--tRNA ligase [Candidatus Micrarchaeia archaeon]